MEVDLVLPKRLKNRASELTELQQVFLDCYIFRLGDPKTIFRYLCATGKTQVESNTMMQGLLRNSDAVEYIKTRKAQLEVHFGGKPKSEGEDAEGKGFDGSEIKSVIMKKISNDLVQSIEEGTLDYKQGAIIEKFMNKVLDYDEKADSAPEPPRIYLPENCLNCRYRVAVEETDETIDECKCCNYRARCIEQGIEYDYKTQLNIEKEDGNSRNS